MTMLTQSDVGAKPLGAQSAHEARAWQRERTRVTLIARSGLRRADRAPWGNRGPVPITARGCEPVLHAGKAALRSSPRRSDSRGPRRRVLSQSIEAALRSGDRA